MKPKDGRTPLITAVTSRPSSDAIEMLLRAGADPHARDNEGKRAIDYLEQVDPQGLAILFEFENKNPVALLRAAMEDGGQTASRPSASEEDDEDDHWASEVNAMITGNRVNLRSAPTTNSRVIRQMNDGDIIYVMDDSEQSDGFWFRVRTADGAVGWVFGQYVYAFVNAP